MSVCVRVCIICTIVHCGNLNASLVVIYGHQVYLASEAWLYP